MLVAPVGRVNRQHCQDITATMKFIPNTVSGPVVGEEAGKLRKVIQKGGQVANHSARETIGRIVRMRRAAVASVGQAAVAE